jgi:hypothetical protein
MMGDRLEHELGRKIGAVLDREISAPHPPKRRRRSLACLPGDHAAVYGPPPQRLKDRPRRPIQSVTGDPRAFAPDRSEHVEHLRWIGFGAFFVSSLVIGGRLLLLARRTGQIPEFLIGVAALGLGPFGYGLGMLAFALASRSLSLSATLMGSALLAMQVGAIAQYLFVGTVFRRGSRWAKAVIWTAIVLLIASYAGDLIENGLVNRRNDGVWLWIGSLTRTAALGWSALESLRYHRVVRHRARLGLADPVVAGSFLLWGVGSGAAFAGALLGHVTRILTGRGVAEFPLLSLAVSLLGLVAAVSIWLAFLPTPTYLRFVRSRSRRAGAIPWSPG